MKKRGSVNEEDGGEERENSNVVRRSEKGNFCWVDTCPTTTNFVILQVKSEYLRTTLTSSVFILGAFGNCICFCTFLIRIFVSCLNLK